MKSWLYIGLFAVLLIILIITVIRAIIRARKERLIKINEIKIENEDLEQIAHNLSSTITYTNKYKKLGFKKEINHVVSGFGNFFAKFNPIHEDSITAAKSIIDNRFLLTKAANSLNSIKKNKYNLTARINTDDPIVSYIAKEIIEVTACNISYDSLVRFLKSYQQIRVVSYEELCVLIPIINLELSKKLVDIMNFSVMTSKKYDQCAKIIEYLEQSPEYSPEMRKKIQQAITKNPEQVIAKLYIDVLDSTLVKDDVVNKIVEHCEENEIDLDKIVEQQQHMLAAKAVIVDNIIASLWNIDSFNFDSIYKEVSLVEEVLTKDPAGKYSNMSLKTKEYYRQEIARVSRRLKISELDVANAALHVSSNENEHIGISLLGDLRDEMYHVLGKRRAPNKKKNFGIYKLIKFVCTVILTAIYSICSFIMSFQLINSMILGIVIIIPFYLYITKIINNLYQRSLPDIVVPMMDYREHVPDSAKTLITVPVLGISGEHLLKVLDHLNLIAANNGTQNISYTLLVDFPALLNEQEEKDIISLIDDKVKKLNREKSTDYIYVIFRKKTYNPIAKEYMGHERKRGAILALNDFLLFGDSEEFYNNKLPYKLENMQYVITLDEDTMLLPDEIVNMIGSIDHPINKPVYEDNRIVRGVSIMQPKMRTKLEEANTSKFTFLFSGEKGYSRYSSAANGLMMKAFDTGFFYGKGIYHIATFQEILVDKFRDNTILSHDIVEGGFVGVKECEATAYEGFPNNIFSYFKRKERWIRGDWQLVPYLFPFIRNRDKKIIRNTTDKVTKHQIFLNAISSLMSFALLVSLVLSVVFGTIQLFVIFVFGEFLLKILYMVLKDLFIFSRITKRTVDILEKYILDICMLPYSAMVETGAVLRALFRMMLNRKKLLMWSTAAQSNTKSRKLGGYIIKMFPNVVLTAFFAVMTYLDFDMAVYYIPIGQLYFFSISLVYVSDLENKHHTYEPDEEDSHFIEGIIARTYRYFADFTDENTGLIADNYQSYENVGIAHRTSPTNIGMSFLAHIVALEDGLISEDEFLETISKTIKTMYSMEKYKGHFYNWYSTTDAKPIGNRYISSVDSGNLKLALRILERYLQQSDMDTDGLEINVWKLAEDMDFSFLYDENAKLFYVGYDWDSDQLCNSHYDLLMSEARQISFLEVAENYVSPEHWAKLSRDRNSAKKPVMMSWGGSTFEYFMPYLFIDVSPYSFEYNTLSNYILAQVKHCDKYNVPFGISESGYYEFDTFLNYQYKSFGVPRTGNKRGAGDELVCSPYSAGLIISMYPKLAINTLMDYEELGMLGSYGFYEAIDFTESRMKSHNEYEIIKSYMAHHQGMMLCGVYNFKRRDFFRDLFMGIDKYRGCAEMLNESIPPLSTGRTKPIEFKKPDGYIPNLMSTIGVYNNTHTYQQIICHSMSNQHYSLTINSRGCGLSKFKDFAINSVDFGGNTESGIGAYIYDNNKVYEFNYLDGKIKPESQNCIININSVSTKAVYNDFSLSQLVYVSQYQNAEIRKYTIVNTSYEAKKVSLYIYEDIAICKMDRYRAHRAFQNLFVQSFVDDDVLYFSRRKREECDEGIAMGWHIVTDDNTNPQYGNDAEELLGRYRKKSNARMFGDNLSIKSTTTNPAACVKIDIELLPDGTRDIYLVQSCNHCINECKDDISILNSVAKLNVNYELSYAKTRASYNFSSMTNSHIVFFNKLLPMIVAPKEYNKKSYHEIEKNRLSIRALWRLGISGDYPLTIIEVGDYEHLHKVEQFLKVYKFMYYKGIVYDLIIICDGDEVYNNDVIQQLIGIRNAYCINDEMLKSHIVILNYNDVMDNELNLLKALSKCSFNCLTPFTTQTNPVYYPKKTNIIISQSNDETKHKNLICFNGLGGFTDNERLEYVVTPSGKNPTPAPWCNILSHGKLGAILSEKGISYMWYVNSRQVPLTPWYNNAVTDKCGMRLLINDLSYNTALMNIGYADKSSGKWSVRHGIGYTVYQKSVDSVTTTVTVFIDKYSDNLVQLINIVNNRLNDMQISVLSDGDITCGASTVTYTLTKNIGIGLLMKNYTADQINNEIMYQYIVDSEEEKPENIEGNFKKTDNFAIEKKYQLFSQKSITLALITGVCADEGDFKSNYVKNNVEDYIELLDDNIKYWQMRTQPFKITTPVQCMDIMANGFLLYQVQASRLFGRCGYYQAGGAYGFRDQLQDSLAMLYIDPFFTRNMLIDFAGHQYIGGDVQHWWHPPYKGVRTKIRDDMLFLPYVLCEYIDFTNDYSILSQEAVYLKSVEIPSSHDDYYHDAIPSDVKESILDHSLRAINCVYSLGQNGLPLMHGGDWNDGMNKVGIMGEGESVWLGIFLYDVINRMVKLLRGIQKDEMAEEYQEKALVIKKALNNSGWDGKWYKRAFYDNGEPLGSKENTECMIDCLSQGWAVISDIGSKKRLNTAMNSVLTHLYDKDINIIKLLTPPFENDKNNPGYIKGYVKGVRENGGQYTHAAIWALKALAKLKRGKDVGRTLNALLPPNHSDSIKKMKQYKVEPYVMAADIYSSEELEGRGGWTWYTGSAAWMYNVIVQDVLGIRIHDDKLTINPCIDPLWDKFAVEFNYYDSKYTISIKNPKGKVSGISYMLLDAREVDGDTIVLSKDTKEHRVYCIM